MISSWRLLLALRWMLLSRWMRSQWFTLCVIGPMIVFGGFYILQPSLLQAAAALRQRLGGGAADDLWGASLALAVVLVAVLLPQALREAFGLLPGDATLDALPIPKISRFFAAAVSLFARSLPLAALAGAAAWLIAPQPPWSGVGVPLLLAFAELSLAALAASIALVRWGRFRPMPVALGGLACAALALGGTLWPPLWWPLLPLWGAAGSLQVAVSGALGLGAEAHEVHAHPAMITAGRVLLAAAAGSVWRFWREPETERARSLPPFRGWGWGTLEAAARRLPAPLAAGLLRDLRLVVRGFSPAVYVSAALAGLCLLAAPVTAARAGWQGARALQAVEAGCALAVLSLAALAPLLLKFQLPYFWIERVQPEPADTLWKSKLWLSALLALPALPLSLVSAGLLAGVTPADWALSAARMVLIALTTALLIGLLAFEIAEEPLLGLFLSGLFSMGLAGLFIFLSPMWPFWVFLYAYLMHHLIERAEAASLRLGMES